jgi:hypothetical protein
MPDRVRLVVQRRGTGVSYPSAGEGLDDGTGRGYTPTGRREPYVNKAASGWILIIVGLVVLIWGSFGFKTREKVVDLGPVEASKTTTHHVPYAPIIGAIIIVGGIVVLVSARRA